ncbi:hypothetical protein ABZX40_14925 [Streptomyces sp. NPDC004610]|uniref:hypothetical protein n=1 Tax=unclassified Streptomyces TaxID=2593676 RepID=UPI0033A57AA4
MGPAPSPSARPPAPRSPAGPRRRSATGNPRKKKATTPDRLLALYTAAHSRPDGRLGPGDDGLDLDRAAEFTTLPPAEITGYAQLLVAADWLTEAETAGGRLRGRLAERVLPVGGLL